MTKKYDIDVLIAGAGPTGSTLAADLLRRGLRVRVVDKALHAFKGSRAKGIQPRTLEVFEDLGILDDAVAEGGSYPLLGVHLGSFTIPFRMFKKYKVMPHTPYPNLLLLAQHRTDAILHRLLGRLGLSVEFGNAIEDFEQDADGVTVMLSSGEKVRCRYLVGADGGASTVRKAAAIPFIGETNDSDRTLLIDAAIDGLSRKRWHIWPRRHGKTVGACPLPHSNQFQIMIRLTPDETPDLDEAALAAQFHTLTGLRLSHITWISVFRPNVRLTESYRAGRVFLAGDAAHVHTPAGGQGLNTGVQDAYNLGWKIAQVIAGAPNSLLDSYEAERLPIAARVLRKSSELYSSLDNKRISGMKRGDEERQLSLSYYGGPLAPANASTTKTLRVGDRAQDAPISGPSGERRLFEVFQGTHFTLLAFGPTAANLLPELNWLSDGAKLLCYAVGTGSRVEQHVLNDTTGNLSKTYGITGDTLMLIRPDGYIGSIITNDWHDAFDNVTKTLTSAR
jgi:2-polyprenyl-6-methoxyphenol hydroxylase-like FAD-dependent oxidoreductase